jgi:4-hydroxy-tetrahydrodipicolinate synthase
MRREGRGRRRRSASCPYYNRPNQEGIYAHFAADRRGGRPADRLYNVPVANVADISVETLARLAKLPMSSAVKDATGNLGRVSAQRIACGRISPAFRQ